MIPLSFIYNNFTSINIITKRSYRFNLLKLIYIFICFIFYTFYFNIFFPFFNFICSFLISLVLAFFRKSPLIDSNSWFSSGFKTFKASTCFIPWPSIAFIYFSNALPRGELENLACSIILLWSNGNIFSAIRNPYLSILPDDNAYIFEVSHL